MSKMVQIRDVPDHVHATLKSRAAKEGMSLSDFIKRELEHVLERPSLREWWEKIEKGKPIGPGKTSAEIIRELRDGR